MKKTNSKAITTVEYSAFQTAYDFFNKELFSGQLPHVLVTLQRKANSRGYFAPNRFDARRTKSGRAHELAMNPDTFRDRSDKDILSTLAHEMAHVWQQSFGKPSRNGYHNTEWARKMKEIGLQPSHTGEPGGNETGSHMTHYILGDGLYTKVCDKLLSKGLKLNWQSQPEMKISLRSSKTKFSCPECNQNAWAKPTANLLCGNCDGCPMEPMEEQNLDDLVPPPDAQEPESAMMNA